MQITVDPLALTKEQREAVAGFILTFPPAVIDGDTIAPTLTELGERLVAVQKDMATPLYPDTISPEAAFGGVKSSDIVATVDAGVITGSVDKSGLPWDERIHSSNRALTAEGLWRKRRGVDDATVARVEGQLRQLMAIPSPTVAVAVTPTATAAIPLPPAAIASPIPLPPASADVAVTSTPVVATPSSAYTPDTAGFLALIGRASTLINEKKLTQEEVNAACISIGIPSFPLAGQRTDLIPQLGALIEAKVNGRA